jgi:hypothetical protein
MNPHEPGTKAHSVTANHLELIECISDYLKEFPEATGDEMRKTIGDMIKGHNEIHHSICKGEL